MKIIYHTNSKTSITVCDTFQRYFGVIQSGLFCFLREADNPLNKPQND